MKILVINGPNINVLNKREKNIYGSVSFEELKCSMVKRASKLGLELITFQSNSEGSIIDFIHKSICNVAGLIINPAGYTHTSIAIRDALLILNIPIVEVHLSNIYARESFRNKSIITDIVNGSICGFGYKGYLLALDAIFSILCE